MTPTARLAHCTLDEFAARLAERTPTPGGGSVAAHLASLGCALGAMACRFTTGEKFAALEGAMASRALELDRLRAECGPLVDEDTQAYDAVTAAYKLPKADDSQKSVRSAAIQRGLLGALEVPARTLARARAALALVRDAAPDVNPNLASDAATAVWCLRSAAEAAFHNVKINAVSLADKPLGAERRAAAERELETARALAESARAALEARLA